MALAQQLHMSRAAQVQRGFARRVPVATSPQRATRHAHVTRAAATETKFIPKWLVVYDHLKSVRAESILANEAARLLETGEWVLVDVRKAEQAAEASPKGAVSIPLYKKIDLSGGFDTTKFLRTAMYRFNGVDPIEPNLEFVQQVVKVTEGGKGVIFACEAGGTLRPSINFPAGKASRSLQAVYKALVEGGPSRVKHLDRGVYGWFQAGLPFDGSYVPDIGRLPSAADNK